MKITIRTNCCDKGKKFLWHIPREACKPQDIDPPVGAFYIRVNHRTYPGPSWERILFCPFCGNELVLPSTVD